MLSENRCRWNRFNLKLLSAEQFSDAWVLFCFKLWLWDQFSQKKQTYIPLKRARSKLLYGPACQKGFLPLYTVSLCTLWFSLQWTGVLSQDWTRQYFCMNCPARTRTNFGKVHKIFKGSSNFWKVLQMSARLFKVQALVQFGEAYQGPLRHFYYLTMLEF